MAPDVSKKYFLGVDVGGTKTHALISDDQGNALGFAEAGPGNHQIVGYPGLKDILQVVVGQALDLAGLTVEQITGAGFGIGGLDWPSQLEDHLNTIAPLGLNCLIDVVNDSIIALMAGASQGWGVVLVAGTGNNCRGRDQYGHEARITGEGSRFGEFGGAADMVEKAIQAISHEWTHRGRKTSLTNLFIESAGTKDLSSLIEGIDLGRCDPDASWAPLIFQAANNGDQTALEIIAQSGRELGELACAVIRQLHIEKDEFDVILAGSVFASGELYTEPLQATIYRQAPNVRLIKLEAPPVIGGVVLGMQRAGMNTKLIHRNLVTSTNRLIEDRLTRN